MTMMKLFTIFCIAVAVVSVHGFSVDKNASQSWRKPYENSDLVEGDMLFPVSSEPTGRGVLRRGSTVAWSNGIVPYEIAPGYALAQQNLIIATMQKMERLIAINNTVCVQFRPRVVSDPYYIVITNGAGCSSYVGQNTGINMVRTVTLQHPGCLIEAIIMHELLHTLGFYHEQSRPDRDSYVRVNYANIQSGMTHNFDKYDNTIVNTQNTPYDYGSVMHYESDAFSVNGLPTIEPLQLGVPIGQRYNMSTIDIQEVRLFYNCSARGSTFASTSTTTSVNLFTVNATASSSWTSSSPVYTRFGGTGSNFYYDRFTIIVPLAGSYVFMSSSNIDTYGYLYMGSFSPSLTSQNLLVDDDDSGGNSQFRFTAYLQPSTTYILVATTYSSGIMGSYLIVVSGLARANITRNNQLFTSSTITSTTVGLTTSGSNIITSSYSSVLTTGHPTYNRNGASNMFYYEAISINASRSGVYTLRSVSNVDTYGYLYLNSFSPSNVGVNLLTQDDDSAGSAQFLISSTLQPSNTYILVFTTFSPSTTTSFSVVGTGPGRISFNRISIVSTTTFSTTTAARSIAPPIGGTWRMRMLHRVTTMVISFMAMDFMLT